MAAGTVDIDYSAGHPVSRVTLRWTADGSGNVSGTLTAPLCGALVRAAFVHSGPGGAPTNLYDVTLLDADGLDVLGGQGANLAVAAPSHVIPGVPMRDGTTVGVGLAQVAGPLELRVANAGAGKSGLAALYVR
jgi:hypothetical protein